MISKQEFRKRTRILWDAMGYLYACYGNSAETIKQTGEYFPDESDERACQILAGCRDLAFEDYLGKQGMGTTPYLLPLDGAGKGRGYDI